MHHALRWMARFFPAPAGRRPEAGRPSLPRHFRELSPEQLAVFFAMLVGFFLRFYRLGTPSLWYDEILLPQTVSYPITYFLKWLTTLEVHPPYPYLLVKAILLFGDSDFALRVVFATVGAVSIPAIYVVGRRLVSPAVGAWCATLLAINPLHIYVSRVVRPYAFIVLFAIASLYFLARYLQTTDRKTIGPLAVANALLLMFHYCGVFAAATTGATLAWAALRRRSWRMGEDVCGFVALFSLFSLPTFYFLSKAISIRAGWVHLASSQSVLFKFFEVALPGLVNFFFSAWQLTLPGYLLVCLGLIALVGRPLWRTILAWSVAIPLLALLLLRHGYQLTPWHLIYLLPAMVMLMAFGADLVTAGKRRLPAVAMAGLLCLGTALFTTALHGKLYEEDSYTGHYKTLARIIPEFVGQGEASIMDPMLFHGTNWYLTRFAAQNPLLGQQAGADRRAATINVFTDAHGAVGHLAKNTEELFAKLGSPTAERDFAGGRIFKFSLARPEPPTIRQLPFETSLTADPANFYRTADSWDNVGVYPYWGDRISPLVNRRWTWFTSSIRNDTPTFPQNITSVIRYVNEGQGDKLRVTARFDDEPPLEVLDIETPEPTKGEGDALAATWRLVREKPYTTLTFRCGLYADLGTPGYNGGNLDKVGLTSLTTRIHAVTGDFFKPDTLAYSTTSHNLRGILSEGDPPRRWRWADGPQASLTFDLPQARDMTLAFAYSNPMDGQQILLSANGTPIWQSEVMAPTPWLRDLRHGTVTFPGQAGRNTLTFSFRAWNGQPVFFSQADHNPYAVAFTKLELRPARADSGEK